MTSLQEIRDLPCEEVAKSQNVRLFDIFLLGPFMIWHGIKAKTVPTWARMLMLLGGAGTILYNVKNYRDTSGRRR